MWSDIMTSTLEASEIAANDEKVQKVACDVAPTAAGIAVTAVTQSEVAGSVAKAAAHAAAKESPKSVAMMVVTPLVAGGVVTVGTALSILTAPLAAGALVLTVVGAGIEKLTES